MTINDKIYFEADTLTEGCTTQIVYKGCLYENNSKIFICILVMVCYGKIFKK